MDPDYDSIAGWTYVHYLAMHPKGTSYYMSSEDFKKIVGEAYSQPHRYFHTMEHINDIFRQIDADPHMLPDTKKLLYVATVFHDIVYDPRSKTNEEDSVAVFERCFSYCVKPGDTDYLHIRDMILKTKNHYQPGMTHAETVFCEFDMASLYTPVNFMQTELDIFKEFQHVSVDEFRKGRIAFLRDCQKKIVSVQDAAVLNMRIEFWMSFRPRVGVMIGSFNKFHNGHMNVLWKAAKLFDKVVIVCGRNPTKPHDPDIAKNVKNMLPFHEVVDWSGTAIDIMKEIVRHGCIVSLVKGFRSDQDIPYEMNLHKFMQDQTRDFNVVYLPCDREFEHLSSSWLRDLASFNMDTNKYYPTHYDYARSWKPKQ